MYFIKLLNSGSLYITKDLGHLRLIADISGHIVLPRASSDDNALVDPYQWKVLQITYNYGK